MWLLTRMRFASDCGTTSVLPLNSLYPRRFSPRTDRRMGYGGALPLSSFCDNYAAEGLDAVANAVAQAIVHHANTRADAEEREKKRYAKALALFCPPLTVLLNRGLNKHFFVSTILSFFGWVPGIYYAWLCVDYS